jgi:hypothetical protein
MAFDRIRGWRTIGFNQGEEIPDVLRGWHLSNREVNKHSSINGVCYSLSMDWMKRKLSQNEQGAQRVDNLEVGRAINRQGLYSNVLKNGSGDQYQPAEGALGLKMVEIKTLGAPLWSGTAWMNDQIAANFRGGAGKAFLMGYYFQRYDTGTASWVDGGGGHAIAWYLSHGTLHMGSIFGGRHVYLFDPNCGEFRLRESELSSFLGLYFEDVKDAFAPHLFPYTYFLRVYEGTKSTKQKVEKNVVSALQRQLQDKQRRGGV